MTKTPSALKWLAEKRARVAHDATRTCQLATALNERHAKLQASLQALDDTIRLYDGAIDPSGITPVNGWAEKYGRRGAFKQALLRLLEEASPEWVSTENLECMLLAEFGIAFPHPGGQKLWRRNTLLSALHALCTAGKIERLAVPSESSHEPRLWRLKQATTATLADL
jgi:hypothetical protein